MPCPSLKKEEAFFLFFLSFIPSRMLYCSLVSFQPKADLQLGAMASNPSLVTRPPEPS